MTGGPVWWVGFALACFLFCVVLYARWRTRREPERGGYIHPHSRNHDDDSGRPS